MNATNETTAAIFRELVESFIDHPHALELSTKEFAGACYWRMKGHADDQPKLVGKSGAHVRALAFVVKALGAGSGTVNTFTLAEPDPAPRRESSPPNVAISYDDEPARELLIRLLERMEIGDFVVVASQKPGAPITVTLTVAVRTPDDYNALTVAPDGGSLTVVAALGTLFRARANKDGVKINIEVVRL